MSKIGYVYVISSIAAIGGILFGYDTAVISGTTEALQSHFKLDDNTLGWIVSCALIGCIIGVAGAGWIIDTLGRKKGMFFSGLLFTISALGCAFPMNIEFLIMARLVGGVGVGVASMAIPIYIAEIAPPNIRGKLVSINQVAIIIGMVMAYTANRYIIDLGDEDWMNNMGWRWMFATEMVPAVLYLMLLYFIVESPRWLAKSQNLERAQLVLRKITRPEFVEATYSAILNNLKEEEGRVGELFRPKRRRITIMAMILALFQAITGINVIMYYAPRIFLSAGIATGDAYGHSIIIGLMMLVFTLVSLSLIDRVGRRILLLVASFGMGASLILLGQAFPNAEEGGGLLLFYTLSYVSFFSVGMGGVYWVVVSEIFPNRVRGRAMTISVIFLWGGNFLVAQFFPLMLSVLMEQVFFVFAVSCGICFLFIYLTVPETKGQSLEEIENKLF
ncbi:MULTISPECIES: sugar porter family MFS transporter [unclassified Arenibacter]|uniref:sugar porter family MFS transporter n=1 Tax=unclassified Arenibacter TaxID=2615047 RepID=UPI000E355964|nr:MULTISPECIES: sugar porter family MFS transporter [unclassified Arenibacter]MCM4164014.1 arabinose-proton symporter [Arenibacter sp. A80]RFT56712.1 MFS transporter [Arenibacter sp. P308M17]